MQYLGSKRRIAKDILPIILQDRKKDQWYVEPFCGGCNLIDKVAGKRIANDSHFYLIELLKAIQEGWQPPKTVTKEEYLHIKNNKEKYRPELVGFVGFLCSFAGKWMNGFAKNNSNTNYALLGYKNLIKQAPNLQEIVFYNVDYRMLKIPEKSIIYCDPPYKDTTKYKDTNPFNHLSFWEWCRNKVKEGHKVFVSEYNAPADFMCIFKKEISTTVNRNKITARVEKLFVYKGRE